jgi:hypothetical protein
LRLRSPYTRARWMALLPLRYRNYLRDRVLRRDRNQHMHMIGHQRPLFDPALFLFGQSSEHLPKVPPQLPVQRAAALRDKHHMIFALPLGVA